MYYSFYKPTTRRFSIAYFLVPFLVMCDVTVSASLLSYNCHNLSCSLVWSRHIYDFFSKGTLSSSAPCDDEGVFAILTYRNLPGHFAMHLISDLVRHLTLVACPLNLSFLSRYVFTLVIVTSPLMHSRV